MLYAVYRDDCTLSPRTLTFRDPSEFMSPTTTQNQLSRHYVIYAPSSSIQKHLLQQQQQQQYHFFYVDANATTKLRQIQSGKSGTNPYLPFFTGD